MHTMIHPHKSNARLTATQKSHDFRAPHYDCVDQSDAVKVMAYVPGVDAAGVEITLAGPDLVVTARKSHFVRVNWQALHLEMAQRDYRLTLRLGHGLDFDALSAELVDGVLTLIVPKKQPTALSVPTRHRRVA